MSEIIGRELEVGIATEATRGTAESTAEKWQKNVTASIIDKAEHTTDDATRGRLEDSDQRRLTQEWVEGDLEGIVHADAIGYQFASLFGIVSTTTVTGSVKKHEFTLQQAITHQTLTMFLKDGSVQDLKVNGAMVSSMELNVTTDDFVRFTSTIMGRSSTSNTSSPSYDTEYDFVGKHATAKIADSEGNLGSANALKLKSFDITFDQGAIRDHVFGNYNPDDLYNAKMSIEGSFTLNYTDNTFKDLYQSDNSKYLQLEVQGDADIGSGNNPKITILLNKAQITDWSRGGGNDEMVTEEVSFKAFYNETDQQQAKVTLQNLTSSYSDVPSN